MGIIVVANCGKSLRKQSKFCVTKHQRHRFWGIQHEIQRQLMVGKIEMRIAVLREVSCIAVFCEIKKEGYCGYLCLVHSLNLMVRIFRPLSLSSACLACRPHLTGGLSHFGWEGGNECLRIPVYVYF